CRRRARAGRHGPAVGAHAAPDRRAEAPLQLLHAADRECLLLRDRYEQPGGIGRVPPLRGRDPRIDRSRQPRVPEHQRAHRGARAAAAGPLPRLPRRPISHRDSHGGDGGPARAGDLRPRALMPHHPSPPLTYRSAGVDRDHKDAILAGLGARIRSTYAKGALGSGDGFGGLFRLSGYRDPVLVSSMDGVGTKVQVAGLADRWRVVGADIVAHGANDVVCQGATPLFMLDYIATARLSATVVSAISEGVAAACREQRITLIGGETAEMPGVYVREGCDVVGCTVGA